MMMRMRMGTHIETIPKFSLSLISNFFKKEDIAPHSGAVCRSHKIIKFKKINVQYRAAQYNNTSPAKTAAIL